MSRRLTPRPTSRTMPLYSWPMTSGGVQGKSPWVAWMSVPQMPAACTSTSTSPGPATGSGASSTVKRLPPRHVASFMRLLVQPHVLHPPVVVEGVVRDEILHVGIVREVFLPPAEHG